MKPPAPHRNWTLAATTALALVLGGLAVVHTTPAEAATVGAGSYTDTLPRGPLAADRLRVDLSTNPRQFVTANAPAGAVPTNDWWSSLPLQEDRLRVQRAAARPPDLLRHVRRRPRLLATTPPPQITGTATGVGEYHYPYAAGPPRRRGRRSTRPTSRWTAGPTGRSRRTGATAPAPCGPPSATACRSPTSRSPAATRRSPPPGTPTVWTNSGATIGFTVQRPRLRRLRPDRARPGRSAAAAITSTWPAGASSRSPCCPPRPSTRTATGRSSPPPTAQYAHAHVTGTRVSYATTRPPSTVDHDVRVHHDGRARAPRPARWSRSTRTSGTSLTGATPLAQTYVSARGPMKVLTGVDQFQHVDEVPPGCCRRCPRSPTAPAPT